MFRVRGSLPPNRRVDLAGIEPLAEQVLLHTAEIRRRIPSEPAVDHAVDRRVFVDVGEDFRHRGPGQLAVDAERLHLAEHAEAAAPLDERVGTCAGERGTAIVQRSIAPETLDGGVDLVSLELFACQALSDLSLAQLPAREHAQAGDIRVGH